MHGLDDAGSSGVTADVSSLAESVGRGQNGRVFVSAEVIGVIVAIVVAAVTILGGVGGLLAWFWRLIESRLTQLDARFAQIDARFAQIDARFAQIDARLDAMSGEIAELRHDVTDLKVAVARLEGPRPTLVLPRLP